LVESLAAEHWSSDQPFSMRENVGTENIFILIFIRVITLQNIKEFAPLASNEEQQFRNSIFEQH